LKELVKYSDLQLGGGQAPDDEAEDRGGGGGSPARGRALRPPARHRHTVPGEGPREGATADVAGEERRGR